MIRLIWRILVFAALTAAVVALAQVDGRTIIEVGPWQVSLQSSVFFIGVLGLIGVLLGLVSGTTWAWARARGALKLRRANKRIGFLQHLVKGYALLAAGVPAKAKAHTVSLKRDDPDAVPADMLRALTAPGGHVPEKDRAALEAALDQADYVPLAIKGLMTLDTVRQDAETMDMLVQIAADKAGDAAWSRQLRYDRAVSARQWTEAATLVVGDDRAAQEKRAALTLEGARVALDAGDAKAALAQSEAARKHAPFWSPAVEVSLMAMIKLGRKRRAFAAFKTAWAEAPHAGLVEVFTALTAKDKPEAALKKARQLVGETPEGYAARLLMTQTLLRSDRTEEASLMLNGLCNDYPTRPVLKLRARVAEGISADQASYWMTQVADAPDGGLWGCNTCGHSQEHWSFVCPSCGTVDSMGWRAVPTFQTDEDAVAAQ